MGVKASALTMWVVYAYPSDYPDKVAARLHEAHPSGPKATERLILGDTVDAVRAVLPSGLFRLPRDPRDPPQIVEVWL